MKIILTIPLLLVLSGCAAVDKVKQVWPRDHDPALASSFINLSIKLDTINCSNKDGIEDSIKEADWINRYADFRSDPQKISTKAIHENLLKAKDSTEIVCQRWVNLSKTRMKIIQEAWRGR
ncbi:hypothetical protein EBS02_05860 [bacterium]|nr:hypothetical protein [bacterium]